MNKFPIIEMLAVYCKYQRLEKPAWREVYTRNLHRVRSCHSKVDGGVKKSFFSIETKSGEIIDLSYNEEELLWSLEPSEFYPNHVVDRVLVLIKRNKHTPSRAHKITPYRFEIIPRTDIEKTKPGTNLPLVYRVYPYRFHSGDIQSAQVIHIETRHLENVMITKHLHYVVETDQRRFFHLVYIMDESDWRLMQEVDDKFFFVR